MRRLLLIGLALALVAPASTAARTSTPGDGTLSIRGGRGLFVVTARGGVIGSFAQGKVVVVDPVDGDGTGPIVSGDDWHHVRSDTTDVWGGTKVRFRLIGGSFKIRLSGRGINLSVVGKGSVTLNGLGTDADGEYSVNGGDYTPITDVPITFPLAAGG